LNVFAQKGAAIPTPDQADLIGLAAAPADDLLGAVLLGQNIVLADERGFFAIQNVLTRRTNDGVAQQQRPARGAGNH
jgi:hypothetical protein